jgi:hypothetical protein
VTLEVSLWLFVLFVLFLKRRVVASSRRGSVSSKASAAFVDEQLSHEASARIHQRGNRESTTLLTIDRTRGLAGSRRREPVSP